jgi:CheY-like chemotaxis protein
LPKNIDLQTITSATPLIIEAEDSQIEQVLFNLATNSRDAMEAGGQLLLTTDSVLISAEESKAFPGLQPGRFARLKVADTGKGMAPEVATDIFDPFYTTKDVGKGTGIGLSIVYGIVASHNGHIECESSPDKGTVFTIYLPQMELSELPQTEKTTRSAPQDPSVEAVTGATLLVVDDEAAIRKICRRVFERAGFTVITAADGEDALEQYRVGYTDIDVVLLDLGMPGMGGENASLS